MEPLSPNSREWISNTNSPKQDEVPPSQHDQRMGTHYSSTSAGYLHHPSNGSHPTSFEYNTHPPPNDYYGDIQGHTVPTSSLGEHSPQGQQPSDPRRSPIYHISTPEPPKQPQQRGYNPEPSMAGTNYFNPSKHSSHSYQQQQPPASFNPMAPRMASNSVNSPSTPIHDDRSSQDQFIPGSNSDPYFHDNSNPATFSSSSTIDQNLPSSTPEYCDNRSHHYMKSHHSSLAQDQIQPTAPPSPPSPFSSSNYSSSSQDYRASSVPQHSQPPINHQHSINPGSHPSYPSAQPSPSLPSVNFHGDYGNHFEDRSRAFSPNVYNPPDIPLHLNGSSNYPSSASAPRHQYPEQNTYPSHPSSNFPPHYPTNKDNPYHVDSPQNYPHYLYQDHPQNYSYSGESFAHSHKPEELLSPHHNIQDPRLSRFRNDPRFPLNQTRSSHSYNHEGMYDLHPRGISTINTKEMQREFYHPRTFGFFSDIYEMKDSLHFQKAFKDGFYHDQWLDVYKDFKKSSKPKVHGLLRVIGANTALALEKGSYIDHCGDKAPIDLDSTRESAAATILFREQDLKSLIKTKKERRFPRTEVWVENQDCAVLANRLSNTFNTNPLVLNMASAKHPNGGWKLGHWAQEECLTRRSDYACSLSNYLNFHSDRDWDYPLPELGAVYTPKVRFFRGTEAEGYPFLAWDEQYSVSCIAVAALHFRHNKHSLSREEYQITRNKIRSIFSIGLLQGHDCLVLGALGCGAFNNPIRQIASIFEDVIQEYAGCFDLVTFAILDDCLEPSLSKFAPFYEMLGHQFSHKVFLPHQENQLSTRNPIQNSPHSKPSDFEGLPDYCYNDDNGRKDSTLNKPNCRHQGACHDWSKTHREEYIHPETKCKHGGLCKDIDQPDHIQKYSHPIFCEHGGKCQKLKDENHCREYRHPPFCRHGGQCRDINDPKHSQEYIHPQECRYRAYCPIEDKKHRQEFHHNFTACRFGKDCTDESFAHLLEFKHPTEKCKHKDKCRDILAYDGTINVRHLKFFYHPDILPPCKFGQNCREKSQEHGEKYSHPCEWGSECKEKSRKHQKRYFHVHVKRCKHGSQCENFSAEHRHRYAHPREKIVKPPCRQGENCLCTDINHLMEYSHPHRITNFCNPININVGIDFRSNLKRTKNMISKHTNNKPPNVPSDILNWVKGLHPVHRCEVDIFKLIIEHGMLISRETQEISPLRTEMRHNPAIDNERKKLNLRPKEFDSWIAAVAKTERLKYLKSDQKHIDQAEAKERSLREEMEKKAKKKMDTVKKQVANLANSKLRQRESGSKGIKYDVDEIMGTNRQVFSIVGPHRGEYGNVFIVLEQDIMYHPDFSFSLNAATSHHNRFRKFPRVCSTRPWIEYSGIDVSETRKLYDATKLHPVAKGWEEIVAQDLMLQYAVKKDTLPSTLSELVNFWHKRDSHGNIEGHLPPVTPISYIKRILIQKSEWDQVPANLKELLKESLGDRYSRVLDVRNSLDDVQKESWNVCCQRNRAPTYQNGFGFSLRDKKGEDVFLPIEIPAAGWFRFVIKAVGTELMVNFTDGHKDTRRVKASEQIVYNVGLNMPNGRSSDRKKLWIRKGNQKDSPALKQDSLFTHGFDFRFPIKYSIAVQPRKGEILVECSQSNLHSSCRFQDSNPQMNNLRYISVSCLSTAVEFLECFIE
eukprot:gb/GECH01010590.1/.p1 GENE.gb/GECH01010590.1/~~gb/GECH01010590.1/.p1  ORF type:complete len:1666 (+),score=343.85 gb/GECH01010590.1/:1-4998(+)